MTHSIDTRPTAAEVDAALDAARLAEETLGRFALAAAHGTDALELVKQRRRAIRGLLAELAGFALVKGATR